MSLGIISDEQLNTLLADSQVGTDGVLIRQINRGRGNVKEKTDEERAAAAVDSLMIGIENAAAKHNMSPSSVSAYKNGVTSLSDYNGEKKPELENSIKSRKIAVSASAFNRLEAALGSITDEKVNQLKPNAASALAKDMSQIVKNLQDEQGSQQNTQIVVFAPREKVEDDYKVIDVRALEAD